MLKKLIDQIKKLKFSDTVILLVFSLIVIGLGIIFLFPSEQTAPQGPTQTPIQRLNEQVQSGEDFITAPVTPQQYLDTTGGSIPPSGYLLRLWASMENETDLRLEAIEEYPDPYPREDEE